MGKWIMIILFCAAVAGGYIYWTEALNGQLPSWGNLYDQTSEEKALADEVALLTNVWRRERILPELRTEESLCSHAHRYVKEMAKSAGNRDSFQRMVAENTIVLQVSYDKISETGGYASTAQSLVQLWSEDEEDRQVLQDQTLTHRCVRCSQKYCAQLYIRQK